MAQILQKTYQCKACQKDIKLQRKEDDSGWLRFEIDGVTTHNCSAKKKSFGGAGGGGYAAIEKKIDTLSEDVKTLQEAIYRLEATLDGGNRNGGEDDE